MAGSDVKFQQISGGVCVRGNFIISCHRQIVFGLDLYIAATQSRWHFKTSKHRVFCENKNQGASESLLVARRVSSGADISHDSDRLLSRCAGENQNQNQNQNQNYFIVIVQPSTTKLNLAALETVQQQQQQN